MAKILTVRLSIGALVLALLALTFVAAAFWRIQPAVTEATPSAPGISYAPARPLSGWADTRLKRRAGEPVLVFARRATMAVHEATYHCDIDHTLFSLPAYFAARFLLPRYETDPDVTLARMGYLHPAVARCGLCHQRAYILAEALKRGGAQRAGMLALNGHVVTVFFVSGVTYVADADYGVTPFALDRYDGDYAARMRRVAAAYNEVIIGGARAIVWRAYESSDDDVLYEMERLSAEAALQYRLVRQIEFALLAIAGVLALLAGLLQVSALRKARLASR